MKNNKPTKTSGYVKFPSPKGDAVKSVSKKPSQLKQIPRKQPPSKPANKTSPIPPKPGFPFGSNGFGDLGFPSRTEGSSEDKTELIKKVFQEVLGREPDNRDLSYYRFSPMGEDEIRNQLLNGKEHKDLLEKGNKYDEIKEEIGSHKAKVKVLEGQVKDQLEEFKQVNNLLKEKNRYIRQLRKQVESEPEDITSPDTFKYNNEISKDSSDVDVSDIPKEEGLPELPPAPFFTDNLNNKPKKRKSPFSGIFRS